MIVAVAQVKGGVGKSMFAVNLAAGMNRGTVAMIDTDVLQASYVWAETRRRTNDKYFKDKPLPPVPCSRVDSVASFKSEVLRIDKSFQHTVIDSGGFDSDLGRLTIRTADLIVVPTAPDLADMRGTRYTLDVIKQICRDNPPVVVVVGNRFDRPIDVTRFYEHDAKGLDAYTAKTFLRSLKEYPRAFNVGLAAIEYAKYSPAALEFGKLYKELNQLTRKEA